MSIPLAINVIRQEAFDWHQLWNTIFFIPVFGDGLPRYHTYGWTLSFEVWFYLAFALVLYMWKSKANSILIGFLVLGSALVLSFYKGAWFAKISLSPARVGTLCGYLTLPMKKNLEHKTLLIVLFLITLATGYYVILTPEFADHGDVLNSLVFGLKRVGIWGAFSVCLVALTLSLEQLKIGIWPKLLIKLGDASYSMYLIQPMVLIFFGLLRRYANFSELITFPLSVLSTILGSLVLYKYVELPLTKFARKHAKTYFN